MYLKQTKKNGRIYLAVVRNYRQDGCVRQKTVERIGYADEFAGEFADPVAHFKEYVAQLNAQQREDAAEVHLSLERDALISPDGSGTVQLGSAIALGYLDKLGAGRFFAAAPGGAACGRAFELLCAARMLHAVPVHETWNSRVKFPRRCDFSYADLFCAFEDIAKRDSAFVAHLNRRYMEMRGGRRLDGVRLVLSNYEFAWATGAAAGGPDELGSRPNARLCLMIDGGGIPLSYRVVPREMSVAQIADVAASLKEETGAKRVTLVAAQLPDADAVAKALVAQGDGFVLLRQAESLSSEALAWIDDPHGYAVTRNGAFRIKSRRGASADGLGVQLKEIAFSSTSSTRLQALCIVSSEVGSSDAAIFNIYRELWRVHEPFQVIAADFISTPHAIRTDIHLRAHFLVCYTAFFALRVLREDMNWRFNAAQVADALLAMEGAYVAENWFVFNYRTEVTDAIQQAAGIDVGRRLLSRADIRGIPARISGRG